MVLVIASRGLNLSGGEDGRAPAGPRHERNSSPRGPADPDGIAPPDTIDPDGIGHPDIAAALQLDDAPASVRLRRDEPARERLELDPVDRIDRPAPSLRAPAPEIPEEPIWGTERPPRRWRYLLAIPLIALALLAGPWLTGSPPEPAFRADQIDPPAVAATAADTAHQSSHEEPVAPETPAAHQDASTVEHQTIPASPPPAPAIVEPPAMPAPAPQPAAAVEAPPPPVAKPDVVPPPPPAVAQAPVREATAPAPTRRRAPIATAREPAVRHLPLRAKDGPPIDAADLPPLDPAGVPPSSPSADAE